MEFGDIFKILALIGIVGVALYFVSPSMFNSIKGDIPWVKDHVPDAKINESADNPHTGQNAAWDCHAQNASTSDYLCQTNENQTSCAAMSGCFWTVEATQSVFNTPGTVYGKPTFNCKTNSDCMSAFSNSKLKCDAASGLCYQ